MPLKMKVNATSYTLYCPAVKIYTGGSHPQYVYASAGTPGFANFPKPTCMFDSVEKAQKKIDTFINDANDDIAEALTEQMNGTHRFPETAEWNVRREKDRLALIRTFVIVKLDVTECVE